MASFPSRILVASLALALSPTAIAAPVPAPVPLGDASLTIRVVNVRNAKGRLHVDLCSAATFLKDGCPYSASAPAVAPVTVLVMKGVPPGHYAAQLFHDENLNDKMDRGLFGIPKEGVAFSRDALKGMSSPKWDDAEFAYAGGAQAIQVKMRYFIGTPAAQAR